MKYLNIVLWAGVSLNLNAFDLGIDIGHNLKSYGTTSSTGDKEYIYNIESAKYLKENLSSNQIKVETTSNINIKNSISFEDRKIFSQNKDFLISIHHDSVQEKDIKKVRGGFVTDKAEGFSILISRKNENFIKSAFFAELLGKNFIKNGLKVNTYHSLPIQGEGKEFYNKDYGVYFYDDLLVLKNSTPPAILIEMGVISNPKEEYKVKTKEFKIIIKKSIEETITEYKIKV